MMQTKDEAIDVANWDRDPEFAEYPEGARDKTLLYCPDNLPNGFLNAKQPYLFKRSSHRYPDQYWIEIIAYHLGIRMDIDVPPTFVAYDSKINQSGALIEWFLNEIDSTATYEEYEPGGDYCQKYIPNFERKKGRQHNFETVCQIFSDLCGKNDRFKTDWKSYWAKVFAFDALIGNTDRHQENWGLILNPLNGEIRISPVFDNGTSLGHEISSDKLQSYEKLGQLEKYISRGHHHMKWSLHDTAPVDHLGFLIRVVEKFPETRQIVVDCLKRVNNAIFREVLNSLTAFDVSVKLSAERAKFMLILLDLRHSRLLTALEN